MRILIGYDGSDSMDDAMDELARAGLPARTQAVVLSVTTAWGRLPGRNKPRNQDGPGFNFGKQVQHHLDQALKDARTTADRGKRLLKERFRAWEVKAEGAVDDAAEAILEKAEAWKADLIAVGSGRSALGRLFLGSVSQKVLNHARTSVRIVRAGAKKSARPPRILIAVDGSPDSMAAVTVVCDRSWPEKTSVRLVAVDDRPPVLALLAKTATLQERAPYAAREERAWLEGKLEEAVDLLAAAGLDVEPIIKKGDPRRVLLKHAKDWHANSIFLGSRGLNRVERFIIGSVSSAVAVHARCSVEVVKAPKKPKA